MGLREKLKQYSSNTNYKIHNCLTGLALLTSSSCGNSYEHPEADTRYYLNNGRLDDKVKPNGGVFEAFSAYYQRDLEPFSAPGMIHLGLGMGTAFALGTKKSWLGLPLGWTLSMVPEMFNLSNDYINGEEFIEHGFNHLLGVGFFWCTGILSRNYSNNSNRNDNSSGGGRNWHKR